MIPGNLAWLPTGTTLLSFNGPDVKEWCYPKQPQYVLVVREMDEVYFEILYRGEKWAVPKNCLYS
jgi:hypothetical protein